MSSSGIRFLPTLTESGLREFLYPGTLIPIDEELPSFLPPPLSIPQGAANIPSSPNVASHCHYLTSKILTSSDSIAQAHWVHELTTLTLSASAQLTTSRNALDMESVLSAGAQAVNDELRKNLAAAEEALTTSVNMLTVRPTNVASARASLRKTDAEIHAKDLEIQKIKESTKKSININFPKDGKMVQKAAGCTAGGTDNGDAGVIGVSPECGDGVGNPGGLAPRSNVDSRSAHKAVLEKELLKKTHRLKAEEHRAAALRKLLYSAIEELSYLKAYLAVATDSTRSPLLDIPIYRGEKLCSPTRHERQRLKSPRPENTNIYHRHKRPAPGQRAEWIFGEEAERALATTAAEISVKVPSVICVDKADTTWSLDGSDPFATGSQGKRYMTFPPEVAPKSYRSGAGRRRGNRIFAV